MAERAGTPIPDLSAPIAVIGLAASIGANQRIAGESLPPELIHFTAGMMAEALTQAVNYAKRTSSHVGLSVVGGKKGWDVSVVTIAHESGVKKHR